MKALNFNNREKVFWDITLPDENRTRLFLRAPGKNLLAEFRNIKSVDEENADTDEVYLLFAKILSHNRTNARIEVCQIADCMDIDDIYAFFEDYEDFINEACNQKN